MVSSSNNIDFEANDTARVSIQIRGNAVDSVLDVSFYLDRVGVLYSLRSSTGKCTTMVKKLLDI
jgi:hypothetical protein